MGCVHPPVELGWAGSMKTNPQTTLVSLTIHYNKKNSHTHLCSNFSPHPAPLSQRSLTILMRITANSRHVLSSFSEDHVQSKCLSPNATWPVTSRYETLSIYLSIYLSIFWHKKKSYRDVTWRAKWIWALLSAAEKAQQKLIPKVLMVDTFSPYCYIAISSSYIILSTFISLKSILLTTCFIDVMACHSLRLTRHALNRICYDMLYERKRIYMKMKRISSTLWCGL